MYCFLEAIHSPFHRRVTARDQLSKAKIEAIYNTTPIRGGGESRYNTLSSDPLLPSSEIDRVEGERKKRKKSCLFALFPYSSISFSLFCLSFALAAIAHCGEK